MGFTKSLGGIIPYLDRLREPVGKKESTLVRRFNVKHSLFSVDLSTCVRGDKLLTSRGNVVEYVSKTPFEYHTYLDHVIRYSNGSYGARTNDGYVFLNNRKPETDEDIIKIIK